MEGIENLEVEAFKRLFPEQYLFKYLEKSIRPDGRPLTRSRPTSVFLGSLSTAEGSALIKIGCTTMLAGVKLEIMEPAAESPDQGSLAVEFIMPPLCSPKVRPGRPAEESYLITEQLKNALQSSQLVDLRELCIVPGKAVWIVYLDVYCLDADGSLLDAALLASVAALAHLQIPAVCVKDEGKVTRADSSSSPKQGQEQTQSRRLKLREFPLALTVAMKGKYMVADPTAEEEAILDTTITIISDTSNRLVALHKAGGSTLASTATIQDCLAIASRRRKALQKILEDALQNQ